MTKESSWFTSFFKKKANLYTSDGCSYLFSVMLLIYKSILTNTNYYFYKKYFMVSSAVCYNIICYYSCWAYFFFGHHALIEILALNRNPFIKAFYFSGVRLSGSYYPIHDPWRHSITKKNIKGDNLPQNTS